MEKGETSIRTSLSCPTCGGALKDVAEGLTCPSCGVLCAKYIDKKYYFISSPKDAPGSRQTKNKSEWTRFRLASFDYMDTAVGVPEKGATALDLGTGPNQFEEVTSRFASIIHADFVPYPDIEVVTDLSQRLPFLDERFNTVIMTNVLEHMKDPDAFLKESHRVTKKGGKIIGIIPFMLDVHQRPYDFQRFTDIGLAHHLTLAGFTDVMVVPIGAPSELLFTVKQHFYQQLFTFAREEKQLFRRIGVKVLWNVGKLADLLLRHFSHRMRPSADFTLGYGFSARRA